MSDKQDIFTRKERMRENVCCVFYLWERGSKCRGASKIPHTLSKGLSEKQVQNDAAGGKITAGAGGADGEGSFKETSSVQRRTLRGLSPHRREIRRMPVPPLCARAVGFLSGRRNGKTGGIRFTLRPPADGSKLDHGDDRELSIESRQGRGRGKRKYGIPICCQ